jgi:LmbE family N-acetylglucosaminyl deacetylase
MADDTLRLLVLGAHPDDAEYHAGGLATIYRRLGHAVKFVAATDGAAGHHVLRGPELAAVRRAEAAAAASVIGATSEVWDFPDGRLEPTLSLRERVIRELRSWRPDLVLTHRTCDYHPDHRALGQAVADASYMVTVPAVVPDVPHLARDPVVLFLPDRFTRPNPLLADVAVDVGPALEQVVDMLACHASQFFEWLPYNRGAAHEVPSEAAARRAWLREAYSQVPHTLADRYREALVQTYGPERGRLVEHAEVYEASEYAAPLDAAARARLLGFLPGAA